MEKNKVMVRLRAAYYRRAKYEIPVAFSVTRASGSEVKELDRLTDKLFTQDPELAKRCGYFSAELDSGALKKKFRLSNSNY